MSEESEVIETEMQVLENLKKEAHKHDKLSESNFNQFMNISKKLSNLLPKLPKNSDIFAIDDLLYTDDVTGANDADFSSDEKVIVFSAKYIKIYKEIYEYISEWRTNRLLDETYLQTMLLKAPEFIADFENYIFHAFNRNCRRTPSNCCFAVKIFRIALDENCDTVLEDMAEEDDISFLYLWISKLQEIPQAKSIRQKRISDWLRHQSTVIVNIVESKPFKFEEVIQDYLDVYQPEHFDIRYTNRMTYLFSNCDSFVCDHLHHFFTSAKNEHERLERLKNFLIGWCSKFLPEDAVLENVQYPVETKIALEMPFYEILHFHYFNYFKKYIKGYILYTDDELRKMERTSGYDTIKPYLEDADVQDVKFNLNQETADNSTEDDDETDYTIEQFIFYDELMRKLKVLSAIHAACLKCQKLLRTKGHSIGCDTYYLRNGDSPIYDYFNDAFMNLNTKRRSIPWIIEILMKNCPFLFLPKRLEHMADDFVRMLKGEEVDEFTKERLHYTIYS